MSRPKYPTIVLDTPTFGLNELGGGKKKAKKTPTTNASKGGGCGIGPGGFQPGNTCAKGGGLKAPDLKNGNKASMPSETSVKEMQVVASLGGSTGATLVKDPKTGEQFVKKYGNSEGHLKNEFLADSLYRRAGVGVPDSEVYLDSGGAFKLSRYLDDAKPLSALSGARRDAAEAKVRKDFAVDAILGNWDVVGASFDNVMVDGKGDVYRIDNGGSLEYRAQGAKKTAAQWGTDVTEFDSMRNSALNPSAKKVFGGMSDKQVADSIDEVFKGESGLKQAVYSMEAGDLKYRLMDRIKNAELVKHSQLSQSKPTAPVPQPSTPSHSLVSGASLSAHIKGSKKGVDVPPDTKKLLTGTHLKKVEHLNPQGVKDGTFFLPSTGVASTNPNHPVNQQVIEHYKKVLPPGTKVTFVVSSADKATGGFVIKSQGTETVTIPGSSTPTAFTPSSPTIAPVTTVAKPIPGGSATKPSTPTGAVSKPKDADKHPLSETVKVGTIDPATGIETGSEIKLGGARGAASWDSVDDGHPPMSLKESEAAADRLRNKVSTTDMYALGSWKKEARPFRQRMESGQLTDQDISMMKVINNADTYDGVTFRGVEKNIVYQYDPVPLLESVGVGKIWTENAPRCMSRNSQTGYNFSRGDLLMKIRTKTGAYVGKNVSHKSEDEVIGKAGVPHRITRMVKDAQITIPGAKNPKKVRLYVEMEEIETT